jgi:tRNA pseudouridine55 synthase
MQTPPAYSAKSVDGVRAYDAARSGEPLELQPVEVEVTGWQIGSMNGTDLDVSIVCGTGTYIRSLARDLGRATRSAAHLSSLRRIRSGPFHVRDAFSLDCLKSDRPPLRKLSVVAVDE